MTPSPCNRCQRPAEFSVNILISTVGSSIRCQKCSEAVHFCADCIRDWIGEIASVAPSTINRAARRAYTAIAVQRSDHVLW